MKKEPTPSPEPPAADAGEVSDAATDRLEILLEEFQPAAPLPARIDGVVVGRFVGFSGEGPDAAPLVVLTDGAEPRRARAIATVKREDVGREAALMFEGGDPEKPLLMGLIERLAPASERAPVSEKTHDAEAISATADEERVVISATKEIVLECGESSITLTRAGKILIKGAYVLTRATGTNRIVGGNVQIN